MDGMSNNRLDLFHICFQYSAKVTCSIIQQKSLGITESISIFTDRVSSILQNCWYCFIKNFSIQFAKMTNAMLNLINFQATFIIINMKSILLLILVIPTFSKLHQMIAHCKLDPSCPSGYRGKICGDDGIQIDRCAQTNECFTQLIAPFQAQSCSTDYAGSSCSSGVCYFNRQSLQCSSYSSSCPVGQTGIATCQSCSQCPSGKCLILNNYAQCFSKSECYYTKLTAEIVKCDSHRLGKFLSCSCCIRGITENFDPGSHAGLCTTDQLSELPQLQQIKFPESQKNETVTANCSEYVGFMSETQIYKSLVLLGLLVMMLI